MQEERKNKIKEMLSFSAGDEVARRISEMLAIDEDEDDPSRSMHSMESAELSKTSKHSKTGLDSSLVSGGSAGRVGQRGNRGRASGTGSSLSGSIKSSNSGRGAKAGAGAGAGGRGVGQRRTARAGRGNRASVRASVTARHMATLGGDIASGVGEDANQLREHRKMRGECEDCGQKTHDKRMFKTTPLTIPNVVFEGRCLKCKPM